MYTQAMDTMGRETEERGLRSVEEFQLQQRFDANIDDGGFVEAKDWMPENYRKTLIRQISQHAHSEIVGMLQRVGYLNRKPRGGTEILGRLP